MLAGYFLVALLQLPDIQPVQIQGRVVGDDGAPIEGVQIAIDSVRASARTDRDGNFALSILAYPEFPALVRFSGPGLKPLTRPMASDSPQKVMITLQRSTEPAWTVSKCEATPRFGGLFAMAFLVPDDVKVDASGGIDSVNYSVEFMKSRMGYGAGFNWSDGLPHSIQLKDLRDISERDIRFAGGVAVAEYRGVHQDGTHFRHIGGWGETVGYNNAPKDAAVFFDMILDSLCHP